MCALIVTLEADITSLRRAMARANPLVADAAKKMANMSVVGLMRRIGVRTHWSRTGGGGSSVHKQLEARRGRWVAQNRD